MRRVLPFYLVVALPPQASPDLVEAVVGMLPAVRDALACHPMLADVVRIGVVDVAAGSVVLPIADLLRDNIATPAPRRGTDVPYAAALRALRAEINADLTRLRSEGRPMHRPCAWLLLLDEPTDDEASRAEAFTALTTPATYPNVVACGVSVAAALLAGFAYPIEGPGVAYLAEPGTNPAVAVARFTELLVETIVESGHATTDAGSTLVLPPPGDLPAGLAVATAGEPTPV